MCCWRRPALRVVQERARTTGNPMADDNSQRPFGHTDLQSRGDADGQQPARVITIRWRSSRASWARAIPSANSAASGARQSGCAPPVEPAPDGPGNLIPSHEAPHGRPLPPTDLAPPALWQRAARRWRRGLSPTGRRRFPVTKNPAHGHGWLRRGRLRSEIWRPLIPAN